MRACAMPTERLPARPSTNAYRTAEVTWPPGRLADTRPSECRQGGLERSFGELPAPDLSNLADRERWCCEGIVIVVGAKEM